MKTFDQILRAAFEAGRAAAEHGIDANTFEEWRESLSQPGVEVVLG